MILDTPQIDLEEVVDNDQAHVWHHLTQHKPYETAKPPVMISGSGIHVKNAEGTEFIDAVSGGVWTVNVGYGRERIANACLLYTSPSPRDRTRSRMPSSA